MGLFDSLRGNGAELGTLVGIILCVVLALVLLYLLVYGLVYLFMRRKRQDAPAAGQANPESDAQLRREIAAIRTQAEEQVRRTHQELEQGLQRFNDAMVRLVGEVQRTQQSQLDSFGGQLRAVSRVEEERMDQMSEAMSRQFSGYDQRMQQVTQRLDEKLEAHEVQVMRLQKALESGLQQLREDNARQVEEARVQMDAQQQLPLDRRLGESFQQVNARLEKVTQGLEEVQQLTGEALDMEQVLAELRDEEPWGEAQLSTLLSKSLAPEQYAVDVQVSPKEDARAPFVVTLPGDAEGPRYLPLDDGSPMADYRRLMEAVARGEIEAASQAAGALTDALRVAARHTGEAYIRPPYTTDYAVLYLPAEGMYAEALRASGLAGDIRREYRVLLAGPTTLVAMLHSLRAGFRTRAIERRTDEIWQLLGDVKREFGRFSGMLAATQQKLGQASESIEAATRRTRSIQRSLRSAGSVEAVLLEGGESAPPLPDAATLKKLAPQGPAAPLPDDMPEEPDIEPPYVPEARVAGESPRYQPARQVHEEDFYSNEDDDLLEDWS